MLTSYGDISPRTAAYAVAAMLVRAQPYLVLEKFLQPYPLPKNSTKVAKFRRYESLPVATTPLVEGVTPAGKTLTVTDVTATLQQYGDFVTITDVVADTHEDPVFMQAQDVIGEQAAQTVEAVRFGILKAGTNVMRAGGVASRALVATAYSLNMQRKMTRALKRQNAQYITRVVSSTPNFNQESTEAGYVAFVHPDLEPTIRGLAGFINVKDYGSTPPYEFEIGAVEDVRYIRSTIFEPWTDAGAAGATMIGTTDPAVAVDVYPILMLAANAAGSVPLKGEAALTPMVLNPGVPREGDPLGQRGYVSWKTMTTAVILNQAFMIRGEVAVLELT